MSMSKTIHSSGFDNIRGYAVNRWSDGTITRRWEDSDIDRETLRERSKDPMNASGADAAHTATWTDSDGQEWAMPCYLMRLDASTVVMWSCADEAGIDDVTIAAKEQSLHDQIQEFAEDLASQLEL